MKNISKKFALIFMLLSLGLTLSACSIIISNNNNNKPEIKTTLSNQGFNQLEVSATATDISVKYGDKYAVEYEGPNQPLVFTALTEILLSLLPYQNTY